MSHVTPSSSVLSKVLLLPIRVVIAFTRQTNILSWIFLQTHIRTFGWPIRVRTMRVNPPCSFRFPRQGFQSLLQG